MAYDGQTLTLYARPDSPLSHWIRLVLAEKGVEKYQLIEVVGGNEDLAAINPYNAMPTLADRGLVLYESRTIVEYIDERYPHPPLMPVGPASRARHRMAMYQLEHDICRPAEIISEAQATVRKARSMLREALTRLAGDLAAADEAQEDEFSLPECMLAPVLWRLGHYNLRLPVRVRQQLDAYGNALFARPAFADSMSTIEVGMRSLPTA